MSEQVKTKRNQWINAIPFLVFFVVAGTRSLRLKPFTEMIVSLSLLITIIITVLSIAKKGMVTITKSRIYLLVFFLILSLLISFYY